MGKQVTVDYSVPLTVRVDLETKEVLEVWLHLESFQSSPRGRFTRDNTSVCFRDVFIDDWNGEGVVDEFCDGEHPVADEAFAIADRVSIVNPEFPLEFTVDQEVA